MPEPVLVLEGVLDIVGVMVAVEVTAPVFVVVRDKVAVTVAVPDPVREAVPVAVVETEGVVDQEADNV